MKLTANQFWVRLVNATNAQPGRFFIRRKDMKGLRHLLAAAVARSYTRSARAAAIVAMPSTHYGWRADGLGWGQRLSTPLEVSTGIPALQRMGLVVVDELPAHAYHGKLFAGLSSAVEASKGAAGPVMLFVLGDSVPAKLDEWLAESNFEEIEIAGDHD